MIAVFVQCNLAQKLWTRLSYISGISLLQYNKLELVIFHGFWVLFKLGVRYSAKDGDSSNTMASFEGNEWQNFQSKGLEKVFKLVGDTGSLGDDKKGV